MKALIPALIAALLAGCVTAPQRSGQLQREIERQVEDAAAQRREVPSVEQVRAAMLPPISIALPEPRQSEGARFTLSVVDMPARELFVSLAADTEYTTLVHPALDLSITAELKNVTFPEAVRMLAQLYEFDYSIEGTRVVIRPGGLQTKVFQINHLAAYRQGVSNLRVSSGSLSERGAAEWQTPTESDGAKAGRSHQELITRDALAIASNVKQLQFSSDVATLAANDFWSELTRSIEAIVGREVGRSVVVSPHSGVLVLRATRREIEQVESFLRATQLAVERQVILDARIVEVELSEDFQAGINWASFSRTPRIAASFGADAGRLLGASGPRLAPETVAAGGAPISGTGILTDATRIGSMFGLAFQSSNFSALISFLETQGTVHVLSSPRIAALNNQKAVLKVGDEEYHVTGVKAATTTVVGTQVLRDPSSVELQPFFSGVVLDVTPQIDGEGNVMLHVRPTVSEVKTINKEVDLGASGGVIVLPLATTRASEADSVIRARDGQVVVIGGLMRQSSEGDRAQLPGLGDVPLVGNLFRNTRNASRKRELVILIRPQVIQSDADWRSDIADSAERLRELRPPRRPVGLE